MWFAMLGKVEKDDEKFGRKNWDCDGEIAYANASVVHTIMNGAMFNGVKLNGIDKDQDCQTGRQEAKQQDSVMTDFMFKEMNKDTPDDDVISCDDGFKYLGCNKK